MAKTGLFGQPRRSSAEYYQHILEEIKKVNYTSVFGQTKLCLSLQPDGTFYMSLGTGYGNLPMKEARELARFLHSITGDQEESHDEEATGFFGTNPRATS